MDGLGASVRPYRLEQVHATIIGLERTPSSKLAGVVEYLRNDFPSFTVQIGGFREGATYDFTSRGLHPFARSFSVQGNTAVAMGWPPANALDDVRRTLHDRLGASHRYYQSPEDVDNDFYFVLGRFDPGQADPDGVRRVAGELRSFLAHGATLVPVSRETLRVVAYEDPELPWGACRAFRVGDVSVRDLAV